MQRKGRSEDTEMNEGKMGVQGGKGKMQNKGKTAMSLEESSPPPPLSPQHPDGPGYDETLLGVIGILEAVKHESNVAGWIRAGGLWGRGRPTAVEEERMGHGLQDAGSKLAKKRKGGGKGNDAGEDPEMWFEDGATMDYWAGRGRAALGVLGVDIGAGIER